MFFTSCLVCFLQMFENSDGFHNNETKPIKMRCVLMVDPCNFKRTATKYLNPQFCLQNTKFVKLGTTGQKGVIKTLSSGNGGMIFTVRILYLLKEALPKPQCRALK